MPDEAGDARMGVPVWRQALLLSAPQTDERILEWCAPRYSAAYVILHPFISAPGTAMSLFEEDKYPTRAQLLAMCSPVGWDDVIRLIGCASRAELNWLLLSAIGAITNRASGQRIDGFLASLEANGLVMPEEGSFPELLFTNMVTSLQALGHGTVLLSTEHGDEERAVSVAEALDAEADVLDDCWRILCAPDHHVLYTVHWDSFFTLLCGSGDDVDAIVERCGFEGFHSEATTRIYWYEPGDTA